MARLLTLAPDCSGILFCGQMGGVVLTNNCGEPMTNYLSWRDQRTTLTSNSTQFDQPERSPVSSNSRRPTSRTFCDDVLERLGTRELQAVGNELKPGSVTTLLSWLADQNKLPADGMPLNTITHLPAGRSLEVLVDLLNELPRAAEQPIADPWPLIARAAEQATDSELSLALTFFAGPLGERGRVDGISVDNLTVGGLFRAAFRNMAENYDTCSRRVAPQRDWSRIVFSGGLVQKLPLLREFIVNRLGAPHRLCPSSEDALFGLMVLGHVVSGRAKTVAEATTLMR